MRTIASILCLYLFGLCIQPALFPLHDKMAKEMSCCSKKNKSSKSCPGTKDGCCGNDQCNPFYSQCPICAANALTVKKYIVPGNAPVFYTGPTYTSKNVPIISHYQADILRPPQVV